MEILKDWDISKNTSVVLYSKPQLIGYEKIWGINPKTPLPKYCKLCIYKNIPALNDYVPLDVMSISIPPDIQLTDAIDAIKVHTLPIMEYLNDVLNDTDIITNARDGHPEMLYDSIDRINKMIEVAKGCIPMTINSRIFKHNVVEHIKFPVFHPLYH